MEQRTAMKIMEECDNVLDALPDEEFTTWNFLVQLNSIVSKYKGVDCLMHLNFANGNVTQCMCVVTDWKPGAIAFQSDDGEMPRVRVVYPEEYVDFMNEVEPIFDTEYPPFPED